MRGKGLKAALGALLVAAMSLTALPGCSQRGSPVPEELRLVAAVGDWGELPKRVITILLQDEMGYVVMVRDAAAETAWPALAEGEIDIFTDVWYPNQEGYTDEFVPGQVKIVGDLADPTTGIYTGAD